MKVTCNGTFWFDVEMSTVRDYETGEWSATLDIDVEHGMITVHGLSADRLRRLGQMALRVADEIDRLHEEGAEE